MRQLEKTIIVGGGLDLITPHVAMPAGKVIGATNYEPDTLGYTRCQGYERFDGRALASLATYSILQFDAGTAAFLAGDTVTGLASGATGVCIVDGVVSGGVVSGYIALRSVTGEFQDNEALRVSGVTRATSDGLAVENGAANAELDEEYKLASVIAARAMIAAVPGQGPVRGVHTFQNDKYAFRDAVGGASCQMYRATTTGWVLIATSPSIPAGGRVRCINHNFYGAAAKKYAIYGVSDAGFAFEYDGTTFTRIVTGITLALDLPRYIGIHNNHLLLGYDGGSVLYSGTGNPTSFAVIDGAGEFSLGEDLTDILSNSATSTLIFGKNRIGYLTGSSEADFTFQIITDSSGARKDTAVMLDRPLFLDDQGVRDLATSQAFGDWKKGTITRAVEPLIAAKKAGNRRPVGSMRVRAKDQYRLFYADGDGLVIYFGRSSPEVMRFTLGILPSCITSGETTDGEEELYCGAEDGFVYRIDSGTSFDGNPILAYLRFPFDHMGSPNMDKRWHSARIDVTSANTTTDISVAAEYSYGDAGFPTASELVSSVIGGGGFWDAAFWDQFVWDAAIQGKMRVELQGIGVNMSLIISSESINENPHTITARTINYTNRRAIR